jgi:amicyanin
LTSHRILDSRSWELELLKEGFMSKKVIGLISAIVVAGLIGVAVFVVNNGDEAGSPQTSTQQHTTTNQPTEGTTNDVVAADTVEIKGFAYAPATIKVKPGTTVTWTNRDSAAHTVTKEGNTGPDSELLGKDESYSFTFNEAGTYSYFCKPHPYMKGTVIVE